MSVRSSGIGHIALSGVSHRVSGMVSGSGRVFGGAGVRTGIAGRGCESGSIGTIVNLCGKGTHCLERERCLIERP